MEIRICPICGNKYTDHPAISRTRGREEICSSCGIMQALCQLAISTGRFSHTVGVGLWTDTEEKVNFLGDCIDRHMRYDWGDVSKMDWHTNDVAISTNDRLLSAYNIPKDMQDHEGDTKIWIITEADRSATTILFPSEH